MYSDADRKLLHDIAVGMNHEDNLNVWLKFEQGHGAGWVGQLQFSPIFMSGRLEIMEVPGLFCAENCLEQNGF